MFEMKAWFVWIGEEWGDWVHGSTVTDAKKMFWKWWSSEAEEWTQLNPIRCSKLDDIPITRENISLDLTPEEIKEWGINYRDLICDCEICQGKEIKQ